MWAVADDHIAYWSIYFKWQL